MAGGGIGQSQGQSAQGAGSGQQLQQILQQFGGQRPNAMQQLGQQIGNMGQGPQARPQMPIQRPVMGAQPFQGAQPMPMMGSGMTGGQGMPPGGLQLMLRQAGIM